jgi:hypothetical protein
VQRLLRIEGGGHGADFHGPGFREEKNWPNYLREMVYWFDQQLRKQKDDSKQGATATTRSSEAK